MFVHISSRKRVGLGARERLVASGGALGVIVPSTNHPAAYQASPGIFLHPRNFWCIPGIFQGEPKITCISQWNLVPEWDAGVREIFHYNRPRPVPASPLSKLNGH